MDKLTIFFEDPFWVGVFERTLDGKLSACKVTFGAEPRDGEVWDFVLKQYDHLKFSPAVPAKVKQTTDNPKRTRRDARRQTRSSGMGTKSQQALQMQREKQKIECGQISKERKEAEKRRQFDLKQQKRKEKHRGH